MLNLETANQALEDAALGLHEYASLQPTMVGTLILNNLHLQYDMARLVFQYRSPDEQAARFLDGIGLRHQGNPALRVATVTPRGRMALYKHDRATGLTVVNDFPFEPPEVRRLEQDEYEELAFSIATQGIVNATNTRVLTAPGVTRLATELDSVLQDLCARSEQQSAGS